jgi:hypothetical protein
MQIIQSAEAYHLVRLPAQDGSDAMSDQYAVVTASGAQLSPALSLAEAQRWFDGLVADMRARSGPDGDDEMERVRGR